jgi:hypothetical protein
MRETCVVLEEGIMVCLFNLVVQKSLLPTAPLMFGGNLSSEIEASLFNDFLGLCSAMIHRLDQKIGINKIPQVLNLWAIFWGSIFLSALWIPVE